MGKRCLAGLLLLVTASLGVWGVLALERATRIRAEDLVPQPGPLVLDRKGRILHLASGAQGLRIVLLPEGGLPPLVTAAFLAAEDQRFWRHPGVDLLAVIRAVSQNLRAGRIVSGASTLTMQLARLSAPGPRTLRRKLLEAIKSLRIEAGCPKAEILRAYLNRVPLGGNLAGVETAALAYFRKPAAELTAAEAALLAALAKAPTALRPHGPGHSRLLARQRWVLERMAALEFLTRKELAAALSEPLLLPGLEGQRPVFPFHAPHLVQTVLQRRAKAGTGSPRLVTTLDLELQVRAEAVVRSHAAALLRGGASQAAAVVLDNRTLEVVALVGSCAYGKRHLGFNNGALALRSPGSTLKPFLYALALDLGFSTSEVLEDVDRRYRTPQGDFHPANFDRSTHGPVPLREALGNSLNLSAVYLLNLIGAAPFYEVLQKLGLINHPERGPDHYGLGLVVGNPEVHLVQLAAAYAALANQGVYRPARFTLDEPLEPGSQVFSPQAAYIITDILADPLARARIFGGSQAMNPSLRLALKTGTSTRYRDAWCVAYSPEYTFAVWVGNFDGRPTGRLSGASAAAPVLMDLARQIYGSTTPGEFPRPEGIVALTVCAFSGLLPGPGCLHQRRELFFAGTEPTRVCTFHQAPGPWHHLPPSFAAWLRQRHRLKGEGRFRLAGFSPDLDKVFGQSAFFPPGTPPVSSRGGQGVSGAVATPSTPPLPGQVAPIRIFSPLAGDRFVLPPGVESLSLTLKAECRLPYPLLSWFVNGREEGRSGPPYELTLSFPRGRHRISAHGPEGLGDSVEIEVE